MTSHETEGSDREVDSQYESAGSSIGGDTEGEYTPPSTSYLLLGEDACRSYMHTDIQGTKVKVICPRSVSVCQYDKHKSNRKKGVDRAPIGAYLKLITPGGKKTYGSGGEAPITLEAYEELRRSEREELQSNVARLETEGGNSGEEDVEDVTPVAPTPRMSSRRHTAHAYFNDPLDLYFVLRTGSDLDITQDRDHVDECRAAGLGELMFTSTSRAKAEDYIRTMRPIIQAEQREVRDRDRRAAESRRDPRTVREDRPAPAASRRDPSRRSRSPARAPRHRERSPSSSSESDSGTTASSYSSDSSSSSSSSATSDSRRRYRGRRSNRKKKSRPKQKSRRNRKRHHKARSSRSDRKKALKFLGTDESEGQKKYIHGMHINKDEIVKALVPSDLGSKDAKKLFEVAVDVTSMPGMYKVSDLDGLATVEQLSTLMAARGSKSGAQDNLWKSEQRHGLRKVTSRDTLSSYIKSVEGIREAAFDQQNNQFVKYLHHWGYRSSEIDEYSANGGLPLLIRHSYSNFLALLQKLQGLATSSTCSWANSQAGVLLKHHSEKLLQVRGSASDRQGLLLMTYIYLRDAKKKDFLDVSMVGLMWKSVEDRTLMDGQAADGTADRNPTKCDHCRSQALHALLSLTHAKTKCPLRNQSSTVARKLANPLMALKLRDDYKNKPTSELVRVACENEGLS